MPSRIQLRRTKGWAKPADAVVVARPTRWGNPFPVDGDWIMWTAVGLGYKGDPAGRRAAAVALHRAWLLGEPVPMIEPVEGAAAGGWIEFTDGSARTMDDHARGMARSISTMFEPPAWRPVPDLSLLRGHDLACWCAPTLACHADTLIELSNQ